MIGTVFSKDCTYRYTLERQLRPPEEGSPNLGATIAFVMLNPSTADATKNDPTIRRCIGFAEDWGYSRLLVGNLFAFRATDPKELLEAPGAGIDIVGRDNDEWLAAITAEAKITVCAWGAHKLAVDRSAILYRRPHLKALEFTAAGQPRHPLYLKKDLRPVEFSIERPEECPECGRGPLQGISGRCAMGGRGEMANPDWMRFPNAHPWHGIERPQ